MSGDAPTMPERTARDGAVAVRRAHQGAGICVDVVDMGEEQSIRMSDYNAWRVFGILSVLLGLPLSAKANKAIKFGAQGPTTTTEKKT